MTDVTNITTNDVIERMSEAAQEALNTADTMENNCGAVTGIVMSMVPEMVGGRELSQKLAHRLAHVMIEVVRQYGKDLNDAVERIHQGEFKTTVEIIGPDGDEMTKH